MSFRTEQAKVWLEKVRDWVLPIHREEIPKICSLVLLLFLIAFNYNFLKLAKDSIVIPTVGAGVLPFIKMWFLMPMAVAMTAFFSFLNNRYSDFKTFLTILSTFFLFFLFFGFIIYPNKDLFTPTQLHLAVKYIVPKSWSGLCEAIYHLPLTLFYVMCELWSTTVWFVLFWGFVNRVTPLEQAKRFFPLIALAGNMTGVFAPLAYNWATSQTGTNFSGYFATSWSYSVAWICSIFSLTCIAIVGLYVYMNKAIYQHQSNHSHKPKIKNKRKKIPLNQKIHYLFKDRWARSIAIIVLSYNIIINLSEVQWKHQISHLYPNHADYGLYFSEVMFWTGLIAIIADLFLCSKVLRVLGWKFSAQVTPVLCVVTSAGFFGFLSLEYYGSGSVFTALPWTPLVLAVFFGSVQNIIVRAAKYSFFDPTKEMAYIPLSAETSALAKAAIDGIGSRLGKSGGSSIYQLLFLFVGSDLLSCAPAIALIIFVLAGVWLHSIAFLGSGMEDHLAETTTDHKQKTATIGKGVQARPGQVQSTR